MRSLSNSDFLALWEGGERRHPLDRALLILGAAFPETPYESLADWRLGRRNRALATLRSRYFGSRLNGWVACASCGERLEFELDANVIAGDVGDDYPGTGQLQGLDDAHDPIVPIVVNGRAFRLPTSRDLAQAAHAANPHLAAVRIAENCQIDPVGTATWSEEELEQIGEAMAAADPSAETVLSLRCSNCESEWHETLDLVSFLWSEIEIRARRLLLEVHAIASAYGWSEAEILSLSETRRSLYFGMVQS